MESGSKVGGGVRLEIKLEAGVKVEIKMGCKDGGVITVTVKSCDVPTDRLLS